MRSTEEELGVLEVKGLEAAKGRPRLFLGSEGHSVSMHGSDDVLDLVLAQIDELQR
jgi:hypothetical protein